MAAPENTRPAYRIAAEEGFEWIEIDVRLTSDGQHVVYHDSSLDEKTNGQGKIKEHTLKEIQALDAGSWFAPRFKDERLISFRQALDFARNKINIYIDCKDVHPALLVREIRDAGMENQTVIYGGHKLLNEFKTLGVKDLNYMAKCHDEEELAELVSDFSVAIIEVNYKDLTPALVKAAHAKGVAVQVKSLDDDDNPAVWNASIGMGVDYLQTDRPDEIQAAWFRHAVGDKPHCMISAHRGASSLAPENTLASIHGAISLGCDYIELDVRTTSDGQFALMHDSGAGRTTPLDSLVRELTLDRLRSVSAGAWFGKPYHDEKVPTLDEALDAMKGCGRFYLDDKDADPVKLIAALREHGMIDDVAVYGSVDELEALVKIEPSIKTMPPLGRIEDLAAIMTHFKPYAVDTSWDSLSPELIRACHAKGVKVFSDALGDHESLGDYKKAISYGIDLIQTDHPNLVQRAIEQSKK